MKTAVLITSFNRKEKTEKCLASLFSIMDCDVYVVDDNSPDGTSGMVKDKFPEVQLINGNGNLFWSRGMYIAWKTAYDYGNYDFYLWLNDDIELYPFFWEELIHCYEKHGGNCIVSGLIENFEKTEILYGGSDKNKTRVSGNNTTTLEITFMNGNVVLVPSTIVSNIGIIDPAFHHDLGDVDYGLRAIGAGYKVYGTSKAIAAGYPNKVCRVRKWGTSLKNRLITLHSPLGSPPSLNFYYRKKHFGIINASVYFVFLYSLNFLPDSIVKFIWKSKYIDK